MKKERDIYFRLAVFAFAFVFACFVFAPQAISKGISIKMGSIDPPLELDVEKTNGEFASTHIKCQSFKSIVERTSGGEMEVKIYPSGQLGTEMEALEMLQAGTLDISGYPGGPLPNFAPEVLAIQIPYVFRDINVAKKVLYGPLGDELAESIAKKSGIRVLVWSFEGPYYNFMSAKKPIRVPSDLKGQKLRTLQTPNLMEIVKTAGGTPTPIAYSELYTALQQGVVDGCITAIPFVRSIKLDEVIKYINKSDFYLGMSNFYVSEKFWKKLSDQHKRVIKDAAMQAVTTFDGLTLWGESLWVDYFRGEGLEVYTPTASEMKIWKDTVHEHMIDWTKKKIGPEWVDKMLKASEQAEKELYSF